MKKSSYCTLSVVLSAYLMSCAAPQQPATKQIKHTYGIVSVSDTNVVYSLYADCAISSGYTDSSGVKIDTLVWPPSSEATSYFIDSLGPVRAGTVSFNGENFIDDTTSTYYLDPAPLKFDGSYETWSVQGHGTMPAISDSLKGPTDSVRISYPTNALDVPVSSDLTVTWNGSANASEIILFTLQSYQGGTVVTQQLSGTTSSYTIPSSTLTTMSTGRTQVVVERGVYKIGLASDGNYYVMVLWSGSSVDINLH